MDAQVAISEDKTYVTIKVCGNISRNKTLRQIAELSRLGKYFEIRRYLCDLVDARMVDSLAEQYFFAQYDLRNTPYIDTGARIAVLVDPNDHSHDFMETAVRNAGLDLRLFTDVEDAKAYLLQA